MNVDIPIDDIKFDFDCAGTGRVSVECNNRVEENHHILSTELQQSNDIKVSFTKEDPSDQGSFAVLKNFLINVHDHGDQFKHIAYHIDQNYHTDEKVINNNLYFGYIGSMSFTLTHKNCLLYTSPSPRD